MADEPEEREPDYRFTLANERTFLAWMRTSMALLAGGLAARELVDPFDIAGAHTAVAVGAVLLSLVLSIGSLVRWQRVQRAMRRGEALPHPLAAPVLALGVATVAGVIAVLVVVS
jgi:putative membrane protein